ncbi:MAG: DUF4124 domain-containing protein [Burkholderiaceae bacterium]
MKHALLSSFLLAWVTAVAAADTVHRCEGKDGKVTYSNTECPAGTQPVRKVNTTPPVSVEEQKAAKDRAKRDADEAKEIDKQRKTDDAKAERESAEKSKVEAKDRERCDKARRDLEKARSARAELSAQVATIAQIQKADADVKRREDENAKACAR